MSFRLTCPRNSDHVRFEVTAIVQEAWEVGPDGGFKDILGRDGLGVSHRPDAGDLYSCLECGATALVTQDPS
jgi:hypothetical protein